MPQISRISEFPHMHTRHNNIIACMAALSSLSPSSTSTTMKCVPYSYVILWVWNSLSLSYSLTLCRSDPSHRQTGWNFNFQFDPNYSHNVECLFIQCLFKYSSQVCHATTNSLRTHTHECVLCSLLYICTHCTKSFAFSNFTLCPLCSI